MCLSYIYGSSGRVLVYLSEYHLPYEVFIINSLCLTKREYRASCDIEDY